MTLKEFYRFVDVNHYNNQSRWRVGQTLFNLLSDVRPEIAEKLRRTENDPFYTDSEDDPRYKGAIEVIEEEWNKL